MYIHNAKPTTEGNDTKAIALRQCFRHNYFAMKLLVPGHF